MVLVVVFDGAALGTVLVGSMEGEAVVSGVEAAVLSIEASPGEVDATWATGVLSPHDAAKRRTTAADANHPARRLRPRRSGPGQGTQGDGKGRRRTRIVC